MSGSPATAERTSSRRKRGARALAPGFGLMTRPLILSLWALTAARRVEHFCRRNQSGGKRRPTLAELGGRSRARQAPDEPRGRLAAGAEIKSSLLFLDLTASHPTPRESSRASSRPPRALAGCYDFSGIERKSPASLGGSNADEIRPVSMALFNLQIITASCCRRPERLQHT